MRGELARSARSDDRFPEGAISRPGRYLTPTRMRRPWFAGDSIPVSIVALPIARLSPSRGRQAN